MSCEAGLRRAQGRPMNNLIIDLQSWSCSSQIVTNVHLVSHTSAAWQLSRCQVCSPFSCRWSRKGARSTQALVTQWSVLPLGWSLEHQCWLLSFHQYRPKYAFYSSVMYGFLQVVLLVVTQDTPAAAAVLRQCSIVLWWYIYSTVQLIGGKQVFKWVLSRCMCGG